MTNRRNPDPLARLARSDWGAFLSEFDWAHAVHLTTDRATSQRAIVRRFLNSFVRRLAKPAQQTVPYFFAVEQHLEGFPHIHGLVGATTALSVANLQTRWDSGYSRIVRYSPARGAAYYVSKSVLDGGDEYGISTRMPPRLPDRR